MAEISWDAISTFIGERFTIVLLCLNFVVALTIIFLERRNPSATLAWIMILILLPVYFFRAKFYKGKDVSHEQKRANGHDKQSAQPKKSYG